MKILDLSCQMCTVCWVFVIEQTEFVVRQVVVHVWDKQQSGEKLEKAVEQNRTT